MKFYWWSTSLINNVITTLSRSFVWQICILFNHLEYSWIYYCRTVYVNDDRVNIHIISVSPPGSFSLSSQNIIYCTLLGIVKGLEPGYSVWLSRVIVNKRNIRFLHIKNWHMGAVVFGISKKKLFSHIVFFMSQNVHKTPFKIKNFILIFKMWIFLWEKIHLLVVGAKNEN